MASLTGSVVGGTAATKLKIVPSRRYGYLIDQATGVGVITETHVVANGTRGGVDYPVARTITGATATATTAFLSTVNVNAPGTGYVPGDILTPVGGMSNGAARVVVSTTQIISAAVNVAGTGYATGDTITGTSGTFTTAATFTPATLKLITVLINDPGIDFAVGDTVTLDGGTSSTKAIVTVATLRLSSAEVNTLGTGYVVGDTITLAGGTSTTKAILTLTDISLASIAIDDPGTGLFGSEIFTLVGGTNTTAATVTITDVQLVSATVVDAGTTIVPGDLITMAGGAASTNAEVTVVTTKVVSATIDDAGSGGTDGTQVVTGVTGSPGGSSLFQATVEISGGIITQVYSISRPGSYTTNPTSLASEPVTGGGLAGTPKLSVVMGVNTFTITDPGVYSAAIPNLTSDTDATFTGVYGALALVVTTGGTYTVGSATFSATGTDATFDTGVFGAGTFTITNPGNYTVGAGSLTQFATSGAGTGADFSPTKFGINTMTVTTAGNYSVSSATFSTFSTSGSGLNATFQSGSFGLITVTVATGGAYTVNSASMATSTTGSGTGLTLNSVAYGVGTGTVSVAGIFTVTTSTFTTTGGTGTGATFNGATYTTTLGTHAILTIASLGGIASGFDVTISGTSTVPSINGVWQAQVISPTQISIPVTLLTGGAGGSVQLSAEIHRTVENVNDLYAFQASQQLDVGSFTGATKITPTRINYPWPPKILEIEEFTDVGFSGSITTGSMASGSWSNAFQYGPEVALRMAAGPDGKAQASITRTFSYGPPTNSETVRQIYLASGEIIKMGGSLNNGFSVSNSDTASGQTISTGRTISYGVTTIPFCLSGNFISTGSTSATIGIPTVAIRITPSSPTTFRYNESFIYDVVVTTGLLGGQIKDVTTLTTPASGGPTGYFTA